jgi:hypothetical protein
VLTLLCIVRLRPPFVSGPCHSAIHKFEDEKSLAANFHTIPLLLADERVQKWVKYISKRKVNRTQAENEAGTNLRYGR